MKKIVVMSILLSALLACNNADNNNNVNSDTSTTSAPNVTEAPVEQVSDQMTPKGSVFKSVDAGTYLQVDMKLAENGYVNGMWGWSDKNPEKKYVEIKEVEVTQDEGVWFGYFEAKMPKSDNFVNVMVDDEKLALIMDDGTTVKFVKQ